MLQEGNPENQLKKLDMPEETQADFQDNHDAKEIGSDKEDSK